MYGQIFDYLNMHAGAELANATTLGIHFEAVAAGVELHEGAQERQRAQPPLGHCRAHRERQPIQHKLWELLNAHYKSFRASVVSRSECFHRPSTVYPIRTHGRGCHHQQSKRRI